MMYTGNTIKPIRLMITYVAYRNMVLGKNKDALINFIEENDCIYYIKSNFCGMCKNSITRVAFPITSKSGVILPDCLLGIRRIMAIIASIHSIIINNCRYNIDYMNRCLGLYGEWTMYTIQKFINIRLVIINSNFL